MSEMVMVTQDTHVVQSRPLLNRLKTVAGHVRGVQRMVEADAYCIDIIKQTQAVRRALDKVSALVLEAHLNNDVTAVLRDAQQSERERVVTDLLAVFNRTQGNAPAFPDPVSSAERTAQRLDWLGQVEAYVQDIQGLLIADARPVDVLTAIADVQAMLEAFQNRVLAEHLNGCVTTAIRSQQATERERVVRELLQVFDATSRM